MTVNTTWSVPTQKNTNWAFDLGRYLYGGNGTARYTYGQHLRFGGTNVQTVINTTWSST